MAGTSLIRLELVSELNTRHIDRLPKVFEGNEDSALFTHLLVLIFPGDTMVRSI